MSKQIKTEIRAAINLAKGDMKRWMQYIKDDRGLVEDILAAIARAGIMPTSVDVTQYGWAVWYTGNCAERDAVVAAFGLYKFKPDALPKEGEQSYWAEMRHKGGVRMSISLRFSNSACERVKVGTRMVEEDVYETRCID